VKSKVVKTYDYQDETGKMLFQVCRKEPKAFSQRRPNGKGGWIWDLKGVQRVLYRLPDVIAASEVVIVEGEKDADNLAALGFAATTCPMGARKWRDEYNEPLKGKDVVLIPDNDNEGREHMARVGASLNGCAKSLKLLELPNLQSKGDVSDFIQTFDNPEDTAERLSVLIDNAPPYTPPKKLTIEDVILDVTEFSQIELPARSEYLFPWLKEDSINLISGWRGCGKTWFALAILDAVTGSKNCGPWECKKPVPGLFLDGEMTIHDDLERIEMLNLTSVRPNPLYFYPDAYANQLGFSRAHLGSEKWRTDMKRILTTRKVKLWIIDNLASLANGMDENKKQDWDPVNQWLLELRFAGISTIMLHHVNKEGGQRGTSAREDNLDISIMLRKPHDYTPGDGARFIVHFSKARVSNKYSRLIDDVEFKLIEDMKGCCNWEYEAVKESEIKEVLKKIDEGIRYKTISDELGIATGTITKMKNKAMDQGLCTKEGKLTPSGFDFVNQD
jgi:5S rRNA maturation endonuclease (ribonuclease M5)